MGRPASRWAVTPLAPIFSERAEMLARGSGVGYDRGGAVGGAENFDAIPHHGSLVAPGRAGRQAGTIAAARRKASPGPGRALGMACREPLLMANRLFVAGVFALWLGSMSWLLVDKVLPSFRDGEPPIAAGFEPGVPVGWRVEWSGKPVGWAASIRLPGAMKTTELHNRVRLAEVPLLDLAPAWLQQVVGDIGRLRFDAYTRLEFDSLDNFSAFESRIAVNDTPGVLRMNGRVNDSYLEMNIRSGDLTYSPKVFIPNQSAMSEALFPDARLPFMYVGRRWQEEVYNPFRSPSAPVELVEAEVVGIENIETHDKRNVRTMRVEFRGRPGPGIPDAARLQSVTWVEAKEGVVLRQDVVIGNSKLRFERLSDAEAESVCRQLFADGTYAAVGAIFRTTRNEETAAP